MKLMNVKGTSDSLPKEELIKRIIEVKDLYDFSSIVPISSYKDETIEELLTVLKDTLEEKDKIFNDDYFTNITEKYLVSEMIREKVLNLTKQEVPHSVGCYVLKMDFKKDKIVIDATIVVDRDNLKGIIIGKNGQMLKNIGSLARYDIEKYYNKKVYLSLFVKVIENWRSKDSIIKELNEINND